MIWIKPLPLWLINRKLKQIYIPVVNSTDNIAKWLHCTKPLSTIQCNKTLGQDKLVYTTHRLKCAHSAPWYQSINSGVTVISRQRAE